MVARGTGPLFFDAGGVLTVLLERLPGEYVEHHNTHRPHRSLRQRAPGDCGVVEYRPGRPIPRHPTRNRLINEYRQTP